MSAFWIFATCLTVAYIIYYSVVVWRDLSKPKEQVSSSEETFELADTAAPEPTRVVEQTDKEFRAEGGMPVRPKEKEYTNSPAAPAPKKPESPDPDPGPQLDATGAPTTPMAKKIAAAKGGDGPHRRHRLHGAGPGPAGGRHEGRDGHSGHRKDIHDSGEVFRRRNLKEGTGS